MVSNTVLITGGTGFIGSHLARKLVHSGHKVILFDIHPNHNAISDIKDKVVVIEGSVSDYPTLTDAIETHGIESVIHTAAMLSVAAATGLRTAYTVNIEGTFNVLEACRERGVKKVVFVSSLAAFGPSTPIPFHEKSYREPANFYGASKACGEVLGTFYYHAHGIDFRCVRLAVVIGPGRRGKGATVSFSKFVEEVVLGQQGTILVPDFTMLPIIHVSDAVDLISAIWNADSVDRRIFMSGGVATAINDFRDEILKLVPDANIVFQEDPVVEAVAQTWTLLTNVLVIRELDDVYRDFEEIGWKLECDTVQKLAEEFVNEVTKNKDRYSSY